MSQPTRTKMTFRNYDTERTKGKKSYRQRMEDEKLADTEIDTFDPEELKEDIPHDYSVLQTY